MTIAHRYFFLVVSLLLFLPIVSSLNVDIETPLNQSSLNVNNSQYLQGYTPLTLRIWMEDHFDLLYAPLSSLADYWKNDGTATATGDWDIGAYDFAASKGTFNDGLAITEDSTFIGDIETKTRKIILEDGNYGMMGIPGFIRPNDGSVALELGIPPWQQIIPDPLPEFDAPSNYYITFTSGVYSGQTFRIVKSQLNWRTNVDLLELDGDMTSIGTFPTFYISEVVADGNLTVAGETLLKDKLSFTQTDGNEYIDSLADGYLDLGATTNIRCNAFTDVSGLEIKGTAIDTAGYAPLNVHQPSESYWTAVFYNDNYNPAVPHFGYYGYNDGRFSMGTEVATDLGFYTTSYEHERMIIKADGTIWVGNKIYFTQTDGNEYIDSLNDGYMDYGATTGHRFIGGTVSNPEESFAALNLHEAAITDMALISDRSNLVIGNFEYYGMNSIGGYHKYGDSRVNVTDGTDGGEDATYDFRTSEAGVITQYISMDGGNAKINLLKDTSITGDLNATGNITADGYILGKRYVTQYHRNASIDTTSANTWVNITWDLTIDNKTTSGYSLDDSNVSIVIANNGIYRIQGCLHPKNNGVGNQEASLYSRILINGIEAKCLQFANSKEFKTTGIDTMPFTGTIYAKAGQKVQLQYYVTSVNIDFEGDAIFEDGVAGSINFERISN